MKTITVLMFLALALAGCGTKGERTDYKTDAAKGRPLDMPPDLALPRTDGKYFVPEGSGETATTYSEYAKSSTAQNQACTCNASVAPASGVQGKAVQAAAATTEPPKLQARPDGSKSILIGEPFDRCWLKVSQALDQAAIAVEDKDRSKGLFYLKGRSQLSVQARSAEKGPAACEVSASNASGAATYESQRIIETLFKSLSK